MLQKCKFQHRAFVLLSSRSPTNADTHTHTSRQHCNSSQYLDTHTPTFECKVRSGCRVKPSAPCHTFSVWRTPPPLTSAENRTGKSLFRDLIFSNSRGGSQLAKRLCLCDRHCRPFWTMAVTVWNHRKHFAAHFGNKPTCHVSPDSRNLVMIACWGLFSHVYCIIC